MKENNSNKTNDPLQLIFDSFPNYKFTEDGNPMYEGVEMDNWLKTFEYSESAQDFMYDIGATTYRIIGKLEAYAKRTGIDVCKNIENLKTALETLKEEYKNIRFNKTPLKSRKEAENYIDKLGKIFRQLDLLEDTLILGRYSGDSAFEISKDK